MTLKRSPYKSSLLIYGGQAKPLKQSKVKEERLRVISQFGGVDYAGYLVLHFLDNLQLLRQQYYYATWKADGTRYMMLINVDGCYLIDRSFNFRRLEQKPVGKNFKNYFSVSKAKWRGCKEAHLKARITPTSLILMPTILIDPLKEAEVNTPDSPIMSHSSADSPSGSERGLLEQHPSSPIAASFLDPEPADEKTSTALP
ncbi:hypothetical protein F8388_004573 [Cannabis sativa]|uniref:mRNA capping enzyme adenylation domain-containing protein n=1 Tax=Cannabis sativa TaxID=3483 RepID=A0A7J6GPQ1_CANSA|nr:hypothetical protein F8388_004573 [Cannabis sativa]